MRHSNRRGHSPNSPIRLQENPEPTRVRNVRENRNRFMNESDDYYGRYNRFENDVEVDPWDDQDQGRFGEQDYAADRRGNLSDYYDRGSRFSNRSGAFNQDGRFESDKQFQPQRGYGSDRPFERPDSPYDPNNGYGSAWQQDGHYLGSPNHRGKGPKGYKRSTARIKEDICDKLHDDYFLDASNIEIEINNDEVVLSGTVSDRISKRRAEDDVESVSGVRHVENRIRVENKSSDKD